MVSDTKSGSEGRAVTIVAVEQLEHTGGSAGRTDAFLDTVAVDGVDHPDAPVHDESVRAALHELRDDPAEAAGELVAKSDFHPGERTGTL